MNRRNAGRYWQMASDFVANRGEQYDTTVEVNANYPAAKYPVILATGGAGGITIQLPAVLANPYKVYYIKKVDAGAGAITVQRAGADDIDGVVNVVLVNQYESCTMVSDGVATWHLLTPAGWGGFVPPVDSCWLYCVAVGTTYGGAGAAASIVSPGGDYDLILGYQAGANLTISDYNVILGPQAGFTLAANADRNVFAGYRAGYLADGDDDGVAVGYRALYSAAGTYGNVAVGSDAAQTLADGDENVFVGYECGGSAAYASSTVCVGAYAGYSLDQWSTANTFVGYACGRDNDSGAANTCVGHEAGKENEDGGENVYVGYGCGEGVTGYDQNQNTLVGALAATAITTGSYNAGVGYQTLNELTTGEYNATLGWRAALEGNGSFNVCVGARAGLGVTGNDYSYDVYVGYRAGFACTTAGNNVAVGFEALDSATTGGDNTCVGYQAGDVLTTGTYNICVGSGTNPPANNSTYRLNIGGTIYADLSATNNTVGINVSTILAQLHVDQDEAAGARPVLYLDQGDVDDEFIHYEGTSAADQTKTISTINGDGVVQGPKDFLTTAGWAFVGMFRISINGTTRWMPYYAPSTS